MVKKGQALPFAKPSVERRSRDQRPVGRTSRVISSDGADLRSGTKHPDLRECAALRGEANERRDWRARRRRRDVQSLWSQHPRQKGVRDFRRRGTRVRACPSLRGLDLVTPSDFGPRRMWLARTLSTHAQAGGEKHNADRGDNPARARIGSPGFVPVGQYVLQRSVGSRSSEKRLVHSSSEACAGVGEG